MKNYKKAFTMIEVVFVIVVLGILAAIAIPRMAATRTDAEVTKARADIASIRSAIVSERQSRLIKGQNSYISALHGTTSGYLFDGNGSSTLLMYGVKDKDQNGNWHHEGGLVYSFQINGNDVDFTYTPSSGKFDCDHTDANCRLLTE